jgi:hypothetical protein
MEEKIKVPRRAQGSKSGAEKAAPRLELTLRYLCGLLRTDLDDKESGKEWNSIQGQSNELGMDRRTFQRTFNHPDWILAREVATQHHSSRTREKTFGHYVFKHLSAESRKTWEDLKFWVDHQDGQKQIELLVKNLGKRLRQELFIHALVSTNYDISRALFMTGTTRRTIDHWREDLAFAQLFDEIQWHKKNFFEKAMMDLVSERNPLATIWVNKTVNADRGYSEKIRVEHQLTGNTGFSFEDLDLDMDTRRKVLDAIRRRQALKENGKPKQLAEPMVDIEEVEEEIGEE